jgi:hypothetical protein
VSDYTRAINAIIEEADENLRPYIAKSWRMRVIIAMSLLETSRAGFRLAGRRHILLVAEELLPAVGFFADGTERHTP